MNHSHLKMAGASLALTAAIGLGPEFAPAPEAAGAVPGTSEVATAPVPQDAQPAAFFDVLIRIDGVRGPVTRSGYEHWFEAQALQSQVSAPPRGQPGQSYLPPQQFIGNLAQALPPLLQKFGDGHAFAEVELTFLLPVFPAIPVFTIKLWNVRVDAILQREEGAGFSNSFASLSYDRIQWSTSHYESGRGWRINANQAGWDVVNGRRF